MKILITDDEALLRQDLADALERVSPGHEIAFADSYDMAVAKLKENDYDIAFCDIQMPGKNGLALAESIKRLSPRTDIIIVTAYSQYALEAFKLFVKGYLLKPVKDRDLADVLNNLSPPPVVPRHRLEVRCFGKFEAFADGKPIPFRRQRSKEMLAYLISLRGASASRDEICGNLFEYPMTLDRMIANFKIILHTLKKDLEKQGFDTLLVHSRNRYSIDTDQIHCDYFDYITGNSDRENSFHGEFMTQYSWAEQYIYMLENVRGEINEA